MNSIQEHRYIPGLEGLRALAIFFIVAYHFGFSWARGGFLGVDIFFVLSGCLITSKILPLLENKNEFKLRKFWKERISRLLPSAYTMIITTVMWVILFDRELLAKLWGDAVSSALYSTNWWFIFHKLSYFDSFGMPSPLKHLWFLAVQEQFFFLWPIVLMIGLRTFKRRGIFFWIVFAWAICSSLLMGILYNPDIDPSRIYYGTDTRSFELLTGGLLAFVLPVNRLSNKKISTCHRSIINIIGIATFTVFITSAMFTDEFDAFLYRGGLFLFSFNTAFLIACVCQPDSFLSYILSLKPIKWVGTRAYGIYLWHYPIMVLSTPVYEIGNPAYWRVGLQLIVSCAMAELSYRFIETPIRKLGLREFYKRYLSFNLLRWERLTMVKKLSAVLAASVVVVFAIGINSLGKNKENIENTQSYPTEILITSTEEAVSDVNSTVDKVEINVSDRDKASKNISSETSTAYSDKKSEAGPVAVSTAGTDKNTSSSKEQKETNSPPAIKSYKETLAVGDSIMLDIAPYLKKKITNITIDGKVSRQMADALKLAPGYARFNNADKAVVIELGTNGYFTDKQIDSLLNSFSKAHVFLVNTRVPRKWEKTVNEILKNKSEERDNITLIDWYSLAIKHPEYFGRDGVHLKASGSDALANLIRDALN